jgi:histone H3/H4
MYILRFSALLNVDHALKEIQYYQKQTACLIPRLPFIRICRELLDKYSTRPMKVSASAFAALQQVSEAVLVLYFELCNKASIHAKRVTVMPRDSAFVKDFIRTVDPTNPIGHALEWKTPMTAPIAGDSTEVVSTSRTKPVEERTLQLHPASSQSKGKGNRNISRTANRTGVKKGQGVTKIRGKQVRKH